MTRIVIPFHYIRGAAECGIDHDRLFKELLSTFFIEFIELFFPEVLNYLEPDSITFIDKEIFTDVTTGERYEADLLVQAQFQNTHLIS